MKLGPVQRERASSLLRCMADVALVGEREREWGGSGAWSAAVGAFPDSTYHVMYEALRHVIAAMIARRIGAWRHYAAVLLHVRARYVARACLDAAALLDDGWTPGEPLP